MDRDFFAVFIVPGTTDALSVGEKSELTGDIIPPPIKNRLPPPPRQIRLRVATSTLGDFFNEPLSEVVGLLFRRDSVMSGDSVSAKSIQDILLASRKMAKRSKLAKMNGTMVGFFMNGLGHEECYELYSALSVQIEDQEGIGGFDVFGNEECLKVFLKRLQFRSASLEQLIALEEDGA